MKEIVKGRHVELFRLMNGYNTIPNLRYDIQRNCDLMAAVVEWSPGYVPADVSGAAFLMQRELQWFEVLEDKSPPLIKSLKFEVKEDKSSPSKSLELKETKQRSGKTYWGVFVEQRKDLVKEAGQWMKDTSSSCSVISTLIFTVAFAAAFTVPGSNDRGNPVFQKGDSFLWIYIPITLLVVIPVILSAILKLPLYVEMVESTYWPRLFRPVKIWN
ncbi:uncharacterized protein LOC104440266 [Eucalyptus grandis]|uniref:uncharacterized protein LOC104440266 n=1 Tax=Eucalyptus grandis TaxID=71139 RepID=UPI00192F0253|nr:uncharacterized protein LOC104440266 [Eucalyptus grandis]